MRIPTWQRVQRCYFHSEDGNKEKERDVDTVSRPCKGLRPRSSTATVGPACLFGVPKKLVRLLKSFHKDVFVKFEVDGFTHEIR